ncbi:hypothetical protein THIOKS11320117 [Thiocapsa sp. KS1]|nr:hypothetical protein THIOKS11320117 [Thiocapsa sp. KS1]
MDSATGDSVSISLRFSDGSIGTVHDLANGSKAVPKERLEVSPSGGCWNWTTSVALSASAGPASSPRTSGARARDSAPAPPPSSQRCATAGRRRFRWRRSWRRVG